MSNIEKRLDAIAKVILAEDPEAREESIAKLKRLVNGDHIAPNTKVDAEYIVREILLELGAPDHLLGHQMAIDGVLLVVEDRMYINNVTRSLYPRLADMHNSTAARVERAIRHLVDVIWTRGDIDILQEYFGNTTKVDSGKPTNSEFIARVANVVKARLKNVA